MNATITVDDMEDNLVSIFEAELKTTLNERASYTVVHSTGKTQFNITAKDIVALRATMNAVAKQLVVYEKMKSVGEIK